MRIRTARAVAFAGLGCSIVSVALLHVLRSDLAPVTHRLSEYANGSWGWLMTVAFVGLAVALAAFAWIVRETRRDRAGTLAALAAGVAAAATLVSALYRTEITPASEAVHSRASTVAVLALVAVAVLVTFSRRRPGGTGGRKWMAVLASLAVVLAAISPALHDTRWSGLGQRGLWAALLAWMVGACLALPTAAENAADVEAPAGLSPSLR